MTDFLKGYSIQSWLTSCPQGYLAGTEYGHEPGQTEPQMILEDPFMREQAISLTVQLVAGERCALAASAGLIGCAPDEPSKRFLATQTLDEAIGSQYRSALESLSFSFRHSIDRRPMTAWRGRHEFRY